MRHLAILLLFCGSAYGQIEVPAEVEGYKPIVATIKAQVPEGATFTGGWKLDGGGEFIPNGESSVNIWAAPGKHQIKYTGYWVLTSSVSFKDGDGETVTIESFLGSGFINEKAEFTVLGGAEPDPPKPGPNPKPGPGPKQDYQIVFFVESENLETLPQAQRVLITSQRFRDQVRDLGSKLILVMDDDQISGGVPDRWKPWADAAKGQTLPLVGLAPMGGGSIEVFPLPADRNAMFRLLEEAR